MDDRFSRTELLLGKEGMEVLKNSTVAVFGIGGVGSFAAEALVRAGLGRIIIVDYDIIDVTNINRQIHSTSKTVGLPKVKVMADRLLEINPYLQIKGIEGQYSDERKNAFLSLDYDYIVDAIDMVYTKVDLIESCKNLNIPIISCMAVGNKLDPTMLQVGDIYKTNTCPIAKIMRRELKKRNVHGLKVVWSPEKPLKIDFERRKLDKAVLGSISFVPSVAGLIIASEVVKDLMEV